MTRSVYQPGPPHPSHIEIHAESEVLYGMPGAGEGNLASHATQAVSDLRLTPSEWDYIQEIDQEVLDRPDVRALRSGLYARGDQLTVVHSDGVAKITGAILMRHGYGLSIIRDGMLAAQIHDIGKDDPAIQRLIRQPRRLTDDEMAVVSRHPKIAAERAAQAELPDYVVQGVGQHHAYQARRYGVDLETAYHAGQTGLMTRGQIFGVTLATSDVYEASRAVRPEQSTRSAEESFAFVAALAIPREFKQTLGELVGQSGIA